MNLSLLRSKGIELPEIEMEDGLTAKDIMDKIRSFYHRFEKKSDEWSEAEFLELMCNYPKSMCNRHMTETIKQVIALVYLDSKPTQEKIKDQKEIERLEKQLEKHDLTFEVERQSKEMLANLKNRNYDPGYSYEDLALIFDLSKATIHEAVRQKKREATQLLGQPNLRAEARALALDELKKEEKARILQDSLKGSPINE